MSPASAPFVTTRQGSTGQAMRVTRVVFALDGPRVYFGPKAPLSSSATKPCANRAAGAPSTTS